MKDLARRPGRARIGDLTAEAKQLLGGEFGLYAALYLMTNVMEGFEANAFSITMGKLAREHAIIGRAALERPEMKRLARKLQRARDGAD